MSEPVRIAVTGGRYYADVGAVDRAMCRLVEKHGAISVAHGACPVGGLDALVDAWCRRRGVPVYPFPVDHTKDGPWPAAGPKRNRRMLQEFQPVGLVSFPGERGTRDCTTAADTMGIKVWRPCSA